MQRVFAVQTQIKTALDGSYKLSPLFACSVQNHSYFVVVENCPCQGRIGHENIDPSLLDLDLILLQVFVTAG